MRILITILVFFYSINGLKGQNQDFISIDHIPIVVKNLNELKTLLSESLHFKVKEGREHEGIKNCFIKFQDGTYLEFTTPIDSLQSTGKYYTDFLKARQGGTSLAVSIKSTGRLINYLNTNSIPFTSDSNKVWKTIEPKGIDLFFIDYADKQWRDNKINTTHMNESLSLKSTYVLSSAIDVDLKNIRFSDLVS